MMVKYENDGQVMMVK